MIHLKYVLLQDKSLFWFSDTSFFILGCCQHTHIWSILYINFIRLQKKVELNINLTVYTNNLFIFIYLLSHNVHILLNSEFLKRWRWTTKKSVKQATENARHNNMQPKTCVI